MTLREEARDNLLVIERYGVREGDSDLRPCGAQLQKPATRQNTRVHHVGLYAKNPTASAECYRDLLCMQVVGGSEFAQLGGPLILLREPSPPLDIGPNPSFNKMSS